MSQDGSNTDKKSAVREHFILTILVALIGAGGVIAAALIGVSRSGGNGGNPPPSQTASSSIAATTSQSAAPPTKTAAPVTEPVVSGTITYPASGTAVTEGNLHVAGTVRNLPPRYRLLLFLQWTGDDKYLAGNPYIAPKNGKWSGSKLIYVGDRHSFILWLVAQGPKTINFMNTPTGQNDWSPSGFPRLQVASDSVVLYSIQLNVS